MPFDARRQRLVDQDAANAQLAQFVADRQAEIADQTEALANKHPELGALATLERQHRQALMEMAAEEKRLATAIQLSEQPDGDLAAAEREHRSDLLEIARREGHVAEELLRLQTDDPTPAVLAEQAERNRQLLRQMAKSEQDTDRALRQPDGPTK